MGVTQIVQSDAWHGGVARCEAERVGDLDRLQMPATDVGEDEVPVVVPAVGSRCLVQLLVGAALFQDVNCDRVQSQGATPRRLGLLELRVPLDDR